MIKHISQILITKEKEPIPPPLQIAIQSVKNCFNNCSYTLYDNEKIIEIIRDGISQEALRAYMKIKPYANKASFARYCIIYLQGDWYVDITIKMLKGITIPDNIDFLGFRDLGDGLTPNSLPYNIQNSLFYSNKNNPVLEKAIEIVIENCTIENYGVTPVCTTGPGVLGRALAINGMKSTHILGLFMPLTPNHRIKNRSYILPDGNIVALHKNAWMPDALPADISAFGLKTTNNYIQMWNTRDVYDSSINLIN